ncbi:MAG: FAD-binding oxidoreductase, partial [Thermoplasmata archaeon]|nr:FAD-binding oxidoreductase [Thermoplasmata archaeon]
GGIPPNDDYEFYISAWDAIMNECIKNDASISHHHGIGLTRKKWLAKEMGKRMEMLKKIKAAIDANNIMNPGKMVEYEG